MLRSLAAFIVLALPLLSQGRVVLLGVDGMDHEVTRGMMERGELPTLRALAEGGTFLPLTPTNPAQSPVSWASLTTGQNPGRTGIFDFLKRSIRNGQIYADPGMAEAVKRTYLGTGTRILGYLGALLLALLPYLLLRRRPRLGLLVSCGFLAFLLLALRWIFGQVPSEFEVPRNLRRVPALWETLDREGIPVRSLFAPCAFPAPSLSSGHLLCGLGVPDALGTHGTYAIFEEGRSERETTEMGGRLSPLDGARGNQTFTLEGPRSPTDKRTMRAELTLRSDGEGMAVSSAKDGARVALSETGFSEPLPLRFTWGELIPGVRTLTRFRVLDSSPLRLYSEPLSLDPRYSLPWAPITHPAGFGAELAKVGLFETLGWATATNPYQDEQIDDATLIADIEDVSRSQRALILQQLRLPGWKVHFCVLSTPDRVQHVFWRDLDVEHPAHDPEAARRRGDLIAKSYREIDAFVATITKDVLGPEDCLLLVSDHGFAPFRYAVNLNRWLAEEGYLVASRGGRRDLENDLRRPVSGIDWTKTRAYSLGLGGIWINTRGREPSGIVPIEKQAALAEEIAAKLSAYYHGDRRVIRSVSKSAEIYRGDAVKDAPDLIVGFERGYRVSWQSCLLGMDEPTVFENHSRWSGDHCSVDPSLVPGVLISNRRLRTADGAVSPPTVLDVLPTLRSLLSLEPDSALEGKALLGVPR